MIETYRQADRVSHTGRQSETDRYPGRVRQAGRQNETRRQAE